MPKHSLEEVISVDKLKEALHSIARATEVNLCVIDLIGNVIIWPVNDSPFCAEARKNSDIRENCLRCATHAALEAARQKRPMFYKCPYGLVDFTLPIYYKEEVLGAICGGQIKTDSHTDFLDYVYNQISLGNNDELKKRFENLPTVKSEKLIDISDILLKMTERLTKFGIYMDLEPHQNARTYNRYKLQPALNYIDLNYNKNITLTELSALCCITESYFSRLFSATMNISLSQYITNLRIDNAKELLLDPTKKILAIAYEVGYNDSAYFIRKFKEVTQMTPLEYRIGALK